MDILTAKGLVKYYGKVEGLVKAVDHTSFSVRKESLRGYYELWQSDSPIGISQDFCPILQRQNAVFVQEGIGMGLYLSREIISDQGG